MNGEPKKIAAAVFGFLSGVIGAVCVIISIVGQNNYELLSSSGIAVIMLIAAVLTTGLGFLCGIMLFVKGESFANILGIVAGGTAALTAVLAFVLDGQITKVLFSFLVYDREFFYIAIASVVAGIPTLVLNIVCLAGGNSVNYIDESPNHTVILHRTLQQQPLVYPMADTTTPSVAPAPPLSPSAAGSVLCTAGSYRGGSFPLYSNEHLVFGRDPKSANIVIKSNNSAVSRRHCEVFINGIGSYCLIDYSKNGTYLLDGSRLPRGIPTELQRGVEFYLGDKSNRFQLN